MIIENRETYVKSWWEVRFLPGALASLQRLRQSAYALVLVTNQSAVGRGIIPHEQALEINRRLIKVMESWGGGLDAHYLCPHHPDEGCFCRKPAPGSLLEAKKILGLDLKSSFLIGDAASDMEAALAVGVQGILVLTGRGREQVALLSKATRANSRVVADLSAAVDYIMTPRRIRP